MTRRPRSRPIAGPSFAWDWITALMMFAIFVLSFMLAGCGTIPGFGTTAGTSVTFKGQICGQEADFVLADLKDRSAATATVTCPGGGSITIATTDSSTSAVIAQQAAIVEQLTALVARLAVP